MCRSRSSKKLSLCAWLTWLNLFISGLLFGPGVAHLCAYPKAVQAQGSPSEIEDLVYLSLKQKKSIKWFVAPTNIFLSRIVLIPREDFLPPLYTLDLRYPLKSVLYQSFLEMNLRYLLADQVKALLDYQEQLAKFKAFQKRAKKLLGPYWQELMAGETSYKDSSTNTELLPVVDIGSLFSALQSGPSGRVSLSTLGGSGTKTMPGFSRYQRPKPKNISRAEESGGETPGLIQNVLKAVFGLIDWLGKNKEILLGLYLLIVLFAFLLSSAKR